MIVERRQKAKRASRLASIHHMRSVARI